VSCAQRGSASSGDWWCRDAPKLFLIIRCLSSRRRGKDWSLPPSHLLHRKMSSSEDPNAQGGKSIFGTVHLFFCDCEKKRKVVQFKRKEKKIFEIIEKEGKKILVTHPAGDGDL